MQQTNTINRKINELSFLNLLRIIAAFSVFLQHITQLGDTQTNLINNNGFLSFCKGALCPVMLFFLISGLLFNRVYYKRLEKNQFSFSKFIKSRFLKLFPLVFLSTLFLYILSFISRYKYEVMFPVATLNLFEFIFGSTIGGYEIFTGNWGGLNGALWYINVLLLCYAVGLLIFALNKKVKAKYLFVIPLFLGLGMYFYGQNLPFFNKLVGIGFVNFSLGFYCNYLLEYLFNKTSKTKIVTSLISLIPIGAFLSFYIIMVMKKGAYYLFDYSSLGFTNILLWIPLMLILQNLSMLNKVCSSKFVSKCGEISFDFYAWHIFIISISYIVIKVNNIQITKPGILFLVVFLSCIVFSILSNFLVSNLLTKKIKPLLNI